MGDFRTWVEVGRQYYSQSVIGVKVECTVELMRSIFCSGLVIKGKRKYVLVLQCFDVFYLFKVV